MKIKKRPMNVGDRYIEILDCDVVLYVVFEVSEILENHLAKLRPLASWSEFEDGPAEFASLEVFGQLPMPMFAAATA